MLSLLITFAPLLAKLLGKALIDDPNTSAETKRAYLQFIESDAERFKTSANLKKSYDNQKARMDAIELEEQKKKEQGGTPV